MQSDTRGLAGQMEAATSDVFRNIQWRQCNWLCCVHKGTKGAAGPRGLHQSVTGLGASSVLLPSPGCVIENILAGRVILFVLLGGSLLSIGGGKKKYFCSCTVCNSGY